MSKRLTYFTTLPNRNDPIINYHNSEILFSHMHDINTFFKLLITKGL